MWTERAVDVATTLLGWVGALDDRMPQSYNEDAALPTWTPPVPPQPTAASALEQAIAQAEAEIASGSMLGSLGPRELTKEQVEEVLDEMVRPALESHGGDITLIDIIDDDVYVKLVGSCSSCPSSIMTMKMGVERLLQDEFPMMRDLIEIS